MAISISAKADVSREFIETPAKEKIEFIWSQPEGKGPWPALVLIHPHQEWPNKIGADVFEQTHSLKYWTDKGFITIAVSQPGYGKSQGPADYCGPRTQAAVASVIEHFRALPFVRAEKVFLYGGSRGAVVASMLATQDALLAGVILKSGVYDLGKAYQSYPWYSLIKLSMIWELGFYDETKMRERSAFSFADKIKAPLLIIHGLNDDRASLESAELFANKVKEYKGIVDFKVITSDHFIPMSRIQDEMAVFMKRYLF